MQGADWWLWGRVGGVKPPAAPTAARIAPQDASRTNPKRALRLPGRERASMILADVPLPVNTVAIERLVVESALAKQPHEKLVDPLVQRQGSGGGGAGDPVAIPVGPRVFDDGS